MRKFIIYLFLFIGLQLNAQCNLIVISKSITPNCANLDGKILLTKVQGGSGYGTYKYLWSNGYTEQNLTAKPGVYTCTVTDKNGCIVVIKDSIINPKKIELNTIYTPILCKDGTSVVTNIVTNGTAPYNYKYFDKVNKDLLLPNINTATVNAGRYRVRVIDAKGCTIETNGFFNIYDSIYNLNVKDSIILATKNKNNGAIYLNIDNKYGPYKYNWSNDKTTKDITRIKTGTYTVNIQDKNKCLHTKSYFVNYIIPNVAKLDTNIFEPTLGQNYPNPLIYKTVIEYIIPSKSKSYIYIFNENGIKMSIELDSKENEIIIEKDPEKLKPGLYYYKLVVNNKIIDTKKMQVY